MQENINNKYNTKDSCSNVNTCYIDQENNDSTHTKMFSYDENLINLNIIGEGVTKLNNCSNPITISKKGKHKSFKDTLPDGSTTKNKAEYLDSQEKQSISEVLDNQAKKLSEQTEIEKETNQLIKASNSLEAKVKEAKQLEAFKAVKQTLREKTLTKVMGMIQRDYEGSEIGLLLTDLATALTEKGICVTSTCYAQLKKDLATLADNDKDRKQMLSIAIAYGLPKLKPLYENKTKQNSFSSKNTVISKLKQEEELPDNAYEVAVDENGNPLCF